MLETQSYNLVRTKLARLRPFSQKASTYDLVRSEAEGLRLFSQKAQSYQGVTTVFTESPKLRLRCHRAHCYDMCSTRILGVPSSLFF